MEPVVTVLPTEEPDTMPHSAEEITATLAGPPAEAPAMEFARSMKNWAMPVLSRKAPKITNSTMKLMQALMGVPSTPLSRV